MRAQMHESSFCRLIHHTYELAADGFCKGSHGKVLTSGNMPDRMLHRGKLQTPDAVAMASAIEQSICLDCTDRY